MSTPMTPAQAAQQSNRGPGGKYATKTHSEADLTLAAAPALAQSQQRELIGLTDALEFEAGKAVEAVRWDARTGGGFCAGAVRYIDGTVDEDGPAQQVQELIETAEDPAQTRADLVLSQRPDVADAQGWTAMKDIAPAQTDSIDSSDPLHIDGADAEGRYTYFSVGRDEETGMLYADFNLAVDEKFAAPPEIENGDEDARREYLEERSHLIEPVVREFYGADAEVDLGGDDAVASRRFELGTSRTSLDSATSVAYNSSVQFLNDTNPGAFGSRGFHRRLGEAFEKYDEENDDAQG